MEEWGTVVGGPRAGVVEGGGAWNDPVSVSSFCLCSVSLLLSKLTFRKPGRRECFQSGEYQELTRPTRYSCPQEKTGNPGTLSQSLPFVDLSLWVAANKDF